MGTATDRAQAHSEMFGCTQAEIDRFISESTATPQMLAISVLSDAQELIELHDDNRARQHINIAKYIIQKTMTEGQ